jgi:hypothetical protein
VAIIEGELTHKELYRSLRLFLRAEGIPDIKQELPFRPRNDTETAAMFAFMDSVRGSFFDFAVNIMDVCIARAKVYDPKLSLRPLFPRKIRVLRNSILSPYLKHIAASQRHTIHKSSILNLSTMANT